MAEAAIIVILAHFLGDYPLQGEFLATWKSKSQYVLFVHSFIWAGLVAGALMLFGLYAPWKFAFLIIVHFLIDGWKCTNWKDHKDTQPVFIAWGPKITGMQAFFIDQMLHAIQLAVVLVA